MTAEGKNLGAWLKEILSTARMAGAGPTRSGLRAQARISFRDKGKAVVRCLTVHTDAAAKYKPDDSVSFDTFCKDTFGLHGLARRMPGVTWQTAGSVCQEAVDEAVAAGMDHRTTNLRKEVSAALREVATLGRAHTKRTEAEIKKARAGIMSWLDHGFKHGMDKDDIDDMVKEALVKSVLEL